MFTCNIPGSGSLIPMMALLWLHYTILLIHCQLQLGCI